MQLVPSFGSIWLASLIVLLPAVGVHGQKAKPAPAKADWIDSSKLSTGKYHGKLKTTPGSDGFFELEMELPVAGKKTKITAEFQMQAKAKVRTMVLGESFDDKGNPIKLDAKRLSELKGKGEDRKLPGYECSQEELRVGQIVQVTLVSVPRAPGASPKGKATTEPDAGSSKPPKTKQVRLLVILQSDEAPNVKGSDKKK
ncbi:MAG: hypothetical protein SNJ82_01860 [Gemmataceae bacterium]